MSVDLDRQLQEYARHLDEAQGVLTFDDIMQRSGDVQVIPRPIDQQSRRQRRLVAVAATGLVVLVVLIAVQLLAATDAPPDPVDLPTTTTWPGPVPEGQTSMGVITLESDDDGDGLWSWDDPRDTDIEWVDVARLAFSSEGQPHWYIELEAKPPLATDLEPGILITYGLVLDTGGDGTADYVVGINNDAPKAGDFRVWVTNLLTGETDEQIGPPYGFPVEFRHPDEIRPDDGPGPTTMIFTFLSGTAPAGVRSAMLNFYTWTSMTRDGEVIAWDYAPDASWLHVATSAQDPRSEQSAEAPEPEVEARARVLIIPVRNMSGEAAELFIGREVGAGPPAYIEGAVNPSTVAAGATELIAFSVPDGRDWAIFVNPSPDRGPLIIADEIPADASGELPIEIQIDQFGEPGVQTFGDPVPGWFGN